MKASLGRVMSSLPHKLAKACSDFRMDSVALSSILKYQNNLTVVVRNPHFLGLSDITVFWDP